MNILSKRIVTTMAMLALSGVTVLQAENNVNNNNNSVRVSSSSITAIDPQIDYSTGEIEFETSNGIHILDNDGKRVETLNGKSVREIEQEEIDVKNRLLEEERIAKEEQIAEEKRLEEEAELAAKEKEKAEMLANLSNEEVAKMVINGNFGNGKERIVNVENAGHDYKEIQSHVAKLTPKKKAKASVSKQSTPASKSKQSEPVVNSSNGSSNSITMSGTGYSTAQPNLSQFTANGTDLLKNPRVVAVDPTVIPLGTILEVEGYGQYVAADTGGAIKGNRIDIHFQTVAEARQFGRRNVSVTIIK